MVCLRNICINTLHKGDNDNDNDNNNNNNNIFLPIYYYVSVFWYVHNNINDV